MSDQLESPGAAGAAGITPDSLLDRFEQAWRNGESPRIADFLVQEVADRGELLLNLVRIDLEYRWRQHAATATRSSTTAPRLEDYLPRFPDLGRLEQLSEITADAGPLSAKLLRNGTLKTYKGFPHGMPTTHAETINADLLAFIEA